MVAFRCWRKEDIYRNVREADQAPAVSGLWLLNSQAGLRAFNGPGNTKFSPVEIDVAPLQAHELATPQTGRQQDNDLRKDRGLSHCVEHGLDLIAVQDAHFLGDDFRRRDAIGRIAKKQFALHRIGECLVQ